MEHGGEYPATMPQAIKVIDAMRVRCRSWRNCLTPPAAIPASRRCPAGEAEAQELADARLGNRALGFIDLELQALFEELLEARQHSFACPLTAHIDVAVVGLTHEAVATLLQFLVQHIQHQVRQ
jgi:hypothetical protein